VALVYTETRDGTLMGLVDDVLVMLREADGGIRFEVWCGEEEPVHTGLAVDLEEAQARVWRWLERASAVGLFGLEA
jgi:hypothetical protein